VTASRARRRWRRTILAGVVVLVLVGAGAVVLIGPAMIEGGMNRVASDGLPPVSRRARALHGRLAIADMHADTLLWKRNLLDRSERGHVDLPRLEDGHVALQVFASVTKTPRGQNYDSNSADTDNITRLAIVQLQPVRTWSSLTERSIWHAARLARAEADSGGRLRIVRSGPDVSRLLAARARGGRVTGALLSIEGLHNLEGRAENIDRFYAAGFRMAGLVHFFDNELGGSMHGEARTGLTRFGRAIVRRMEEREMIVDVAHASPAVIADVIAMARRPVVSSHGGVQATCRVNRNLSDAQIRAIAATGGLVGIGYWDGAVCSTSPDAVAAAIAHVRDLVGIDHVALGSDFDGAVTTGFDTAGLVHVTEALIRRGFSEEEIGRVMGGNLLAFLERQLPRH